MPSPIYLDHAAATPVDPAVLAAMQPYFIDSFFNPSATYMAAKKVKSALEQARADVAQCLGAKSSEIIFTAGGTEANNLAICGIMQQFPMSNMLTSQIEHESVLAPSHRFNCQEIAVFSNGRLDLADLRKKIDDKTVLVSIGYANNEIGVVQNLKEIAGIIAEIKQKRGPNALPLWLHTDACQAGNHLDLHVSRLKVDLLTLNGGKIYGPKQSGALFVKTGTKLEPFIYGGGQERGLRSGTENVAFALGLAEALKLATKLRASESKRLLALQQSFFKQIRNDLPTAIINGSLTARLPNNLHITLPGQDNERLIFKLDEMGILVAAGSACNASAETPSHVLRATGLDDEAARSSLRLTMGRSTSWSDLNKTIKALAEIVKT